MILQTLYGKIIWLKNIVFKLNPVLKKKLEKLESFIPIIEFKLAILKILKQLLIITVIQRNTKTDVDTFWNADKILNECDSTFLRSLKYYGITPSVLEQQEILKNVKTNL